VLVDGFDIDKSNKMWEAVVVVEGTGTWGLSDPEDARTKGKVSD
jgi:hypothetical protein